MFNDILSKRKLTEIGAYCIAIGLCLLILILVMNLWNADLSVPFAYSGDSMYEGAMIKTVIDQGWYLQNNLLGMPYGQNQYDFPQTNNLDVFIIKFISIFAHGYAQTINLYFLLTFPLVTLISMVVMRQLKISYWVAIIGSLLYTFLPYHFMRGESHLFLSAYYMIPLIVIVAIWLYTDEDILFKFYKDNGKLRWNFTSYKSIAAILIAILISSTYVYYPFFGAFFILIAGISASLKRKSKCPLIASAILVAIIIIGVLVNISPSLIYEYQHGSNPLVASRSFIESETYGLKIVQLLLPVLGHRLPFLANITATYVNYDPLINENVTVTLGLVGSLGFLILILYAIYKISGCTLILFNVKELDVLSILNISAILLATIGGFGTIVAFFFPYIRAYNRISIFIAFFSLLALSLIVNECFQRYSKSRKIRLSFFAILVIILIMGIFDQTTAYDIPHYAQTKAEFINDAQFVQKIENLMPANAMIFQLPYVSFPENPPVYKMTDYDLYKGYLHSNELRWSYGAMKGRDGDTWQNKVSQENPEIMLKDLSLAGFDGVYIDTYGYSDGGKSIISELTNVTSISPLVSDNQRLIFFDITEYNKRIKANYTSEDLEVAKIRSLNP